jgi:hypothetical protein
MSCIRCKNSYPTAGSGLTRGFAGADGYEHCSVPLSGGAQPSDLTYDEDAARTALVERLSRRVLHVAER